jgi:hypothetical protein
VDYARALSMVSPRLLPVLRWAYGVVNHGAFRPESEDSRPDAT